MGSEDDNTDDPLASLNLDNFGEIELSEERIKEIEQQVAEICKTIVEVVNIDQSVAVPKEIANLNEEQLENKIDETVILFAGQVQDPENGAEINQTAQQIHFLIEAAHAKGDLSKHADLELSTQVASELLKADPEAVEMCCISMPEYEEIIKLLQQLPKEGGDQ